MTELTLSPSQGSMNSATGVVSRLRPEAKFLDIIGTNIKYVILYKHADNCTVLYDVLVLVCIKGASAKNTKKYIYTGSLSLFGIPLNRCFCTCKSVSYVSLLLYDYKSFAIRIVLKQVSYFCLSEIFTWSKISFVEQVSRQICLNAS